MKTLLLALSVMALIWLPISAAAWTDNFDAYPLGGLAGNGGWEIWYLGGVDGAVTNAQAQSAPNSARIDPDTDVINDMGGPYATGHWLFTGWCYVPTTGGGGQFLIFLNTYNPGDNWSAQIFIDLDTNAVYDVGVTGASLPLVRGQWSKFTLDIDLVSDVQEVRYNDQLLYTDSWSGHMAPAGTPTIAVVDLYSQGADPVYWDDLSLEDIGATAVEPTSWGHIKSTFK